MPPVDLFLKAKRAEHHIPGLSVGVFRRGKIILAKGYGLANVELSVPATQDTVYQLRSATKPFAGLAIMMLVERGKIALDDKIVKYLPDLPSVWNQITVRHLLSQTSGIQSPPERPDKLESLEEYIQASSQLPLEFQPGEKWNYHNGGYSLLPSLVEKVSGKTFPEFLDEHVFQPLGMRQTRYDDPKFGRQQRVSFIAGDVIRNRVRGYLWEDNRLRYLEIAYPPYAIASAGLYSSVSDLAKWDAALYTEKLLKKSSLREMWARTRLNDGQMADYGLGWEVSNLGGHTSVGHLGRTASATIFRFLDDQLTIVLLCNLESGDPSIAQGVAQLFLPRLKPTAH